MVATVRACGWHSLRLWWAQVRQGTGVSAQAQEASAWQTHLDELEVDDESLLAAQDA